ncbi:MAG: 2-oxoacid:acceptor oxidoreductase subunit alpha [Gammaproteobacteria bacterium]|nr:2-oxoacid:acceptor oxidoreductase subunit alpha [Gammaproteobacteria bacterium]
MATAHPATSDQSVALVGSGGAGVMTAGQMLLEAAARSGRYGLMTRSVGPQIRGGESAALLRIGTHPVGCLADRFDALVAVDWNNIARFAAEILLGPASLIVADPVAGEIPPAITGSGARVLALPLKALADVVPDGRVNMVALGIAAVLCGIPRAALDTVLAAYLEAKGPGSLAAGRQCVDAGFAAAAGAGLTLPPAAAANHVAQRWLITGNQAAGLGALRGGVRFVAGYPITPATEILEWLAPELTRLGGTLVQAEDELASMSMIIGASWGGIPALTATSGPGLSLMAESLGLAVAAEVPLVVVNVMRGGPSTGIPTKSEQTDLNLAVYGVHGDAPHVVVAPLSIADCLFTTQWAVHLAEAMQIPAIVLSDQFLGQANCVIDEPPALELLARRRVAAAPAPGYERYALTADGVSPMSLPGTTGGQYTADGLEHTASGTPSSKAEDHIAQLDKRARKVEGYDYGLHWADVDGDGELAILTWGSTSAAAREACARLRAAGREVRLFALRLLAPSRPAAFAAALAGVTRVLVVEQSHTGQFLRFLRAHYDLPADVRAFHRPGPLGIRPGEIVDAVERWS